MTEYSSQEIALGNERLLTLANHLDGGQRGLTTFDFRRICKVDGDQTCGTSGCAMGEMPFVWPEDWIHCSILDEKPVSLAQHAPTSRGGGTYVLSIRRAGEADDSSWTAQVPAWFALNADELSVLFTPCDNAKARITLGGTGLKQLPPDASAADVAAQLRTVVSLRQNHSQETRAADNRDIVGVEPEIAVSSNKTMPRPEQRFKVGDLVICHVRRSDRNLPDGSGLGFTSHMVDLIGKRMVVTRVFADGDIEAGPDNTDTWAWDPSWLQAAPPVPAFTVGDLVICDRVPAATEVKGYHVTINGSVYFHSYMIQLVGQMLRVTNVHKDGTVAAGVYGSTAWSWKPEWLRLATDAEVKAIPKRVTKAYWLNIYPDTIGGGHNTRGAADTIGLSDRVGCIKVEIDLPEGTGLVAGTEPTFKINWGPSA